MNVRTLFRGLCIAACAFTAAAAWADPPARVGRITYIEGAVSFYADREDGWRKAQINYPVTGENSLWTEGNARTEVRIGPSAIRANDDTVFDFVNLQDEIALGFLQRGSINVRLRQFGTLDTSDTLQIDTNEGRFTLEGNGRYRLDVMTGTGESRIAVFSGMARFDSANSRDTRLTIDAGKQFTARINGSATDFRYDNAAETAFDRWAAARDQQWDQTHSRYARADMGNGGRETLISPYMTGYEDLDANGEWIDDNEYGRLWAPRVVITGWAPYRYGRWSYVRPWGWTWIDDAPWGFAPFHYGRWVQVRSRWCWWPGPYIGRPVYAPALVAWFGGAGLAISSGPSVGWFPLAPREYYIPRYTTNSQYIRRINYVTNNITVINAPARYRNQVPGATVVPNQVFINGNPVGSHVAHLPPQAVAGHAPIASLDIPRPARNNFAQMPDRRQDGRPANPAPNSRFGGEAPPLPVTGQTRPAPGAPTPKFRSSEPSVGGPLPVHRAAEPVPTPAVPANATPAPVNPPISRTRTQPAYAPPLSAVPAGTGTVPVEPAPVIRDREVRPDARSSYPRANARPQPDVQSQPVPQVAAPVLAPRPLTPPPQPVVKEPPKVKTAPENAAKPHHEGQPDAKTENKDKPPKPGVAKD